MRLTKVYIWCAVNSFGPYVVHQTPKIAPPTNSQLRRDFLFFSDFVCEFLSATGNRLLAAHLSRQFPKTLSKQEKIVIKNSEEFESRLGRINTAKDGISDTLARRPSFGLRPCAQCGGRDFHTLYTRDAPRHRIRRRKQCRDCGSRFSTYEEIKMDDQS